LLREFIASSANSRTEASRLATDWMDKGAEYLRGRIVVAQLMGVLVLFCKTLPTLFFMVKLLKDFRIQTQLLRFLSAACSTIGLNWQREGREK
jgi:hypothetical protein